ncbi:MAG: PP2C family serine/threonine-protein phosphatase [Pseudomonadales bacterium]
MQYAADRIQGARDYQQDEFGIIDGDDLIADGEPLKVFVIADGMGGHNSGEQASAVAVMSFVKEFAATKGPVTDRLRTTLASANHALHQKVQDSPELRGMGTTLLAAALTPTTLQWISVGDSKLRLFKAATEELLNINADHSMSPVIDALEQGDQSTTGIDRNSLRSALMGEDIPLVDVSSQPLRLEAGDVLLLASDGLDTLPDETICELLSQARDQSTEAVVQQLLEAVEQKRAPDQDNATVLVVYPNEGKPLRAPGKPGRSMPGNSKVWGIGAAGVLALVLALWMFATNDTGSIVDSNPDTSTEDALTTEKVGSKETENDEFKPDEDSVVEPVTDDSESTDVPKTGLEDEQVSDNSPQGPDDE